MVTEEVQLETTAGTFSVLDYGGDEPDCLLIHGTGQNVMAWRDFTRVFSCHHRVVAFDMRGHGRTWESSTNAEQYWQGIGPIIKRLACRGRS